MKILHEKKKRKTSNSVTYTTGDIKLNCDHFNKMLNGKATNINTTGILNGTFKNSEADKICSSVGTFASISPDGANSVTLAGDSVSTSAGDSGCCGESLTNTTLTKLNEAGGKKGRKVTRYFVRPQNIWCAKKSDILNTLIDHADENCTIYTLNNLDDNKDVTKLTNKDVIYYYEDGILYDKNRVRVMDYDLAVKHEENREKLDVEHATDAQIEKVYSDRITGNMNEEFNNQSTDELDLDFDDIILESNNNETQICCICGEKIVGYGNNPEPYKHYGRCCDACNIKFVIPARLQELDFNEDNFEE